MRFTVSYKSGEKIQKFRITECPTRILKSFFDKIEIEIIRKESRPNHKPSIQVFINNGDDKLELTPSDTSKPYINPLRCRCILKHSDSKLFLIWVIFSRHLW